MAFGIGTNANRADAGPIRERQKEIACYCWFTNTGKMMSTMLKVKDEDGEVRMIRHIEVLSQEEKMYAGIASMEFDCIITILEQQISVKLIYYKEENSGYWFIGRNCKNTVCIL